MKLHEFHIGECGAGVVGDSHAVTGSDVWVRCLAVDLAKAACGEQYGFSAQLVERAIEFIDEVQANYGAGLDDELGSEGVRAKMEVRNGVCAGEECAAAVP